MAGAPLEPSEPLDGVFGGPWDRARDILDLFREAQVLRYSWMGRAPWDEIDWTLAWEARRVESAAYAHWKRKIDPAYKARRKVQDREEYSRIKGDPKRLANLRSKQAAYARRRWAKIKASPELLAAHREARRKMAERKKALEAEEP